VTVNPKYSIDFGSKDNPADTDVSYALGDTAKGGLQATPGPEYTGALPADQVCLDQ